jgi:hypothetical protein
MKKKIDKPIPPPVRIVQEGIDPELRNELIFCINCKFSREYSNRIICRNKKSSFVYRNEFKEWYKFKECRAVNVNNDCHYFKPSIFYKIRRWFK